MENVSADELATQLVSEQKVTLKINDEIYPVVKNISENLLRINALLAENKALLEKVIHGSLKVVQ